MIDEAALDALVTAVVRAHDPAERFASAISAAVTSRPPAQRAARPQARRTADAQWRSMADTQAAYRTHQGRVRAKYGDPDELMARLQSRGGGLAARLWS